MTRREEFELIVDAFAEYKGRHSYALRFLIELACDLQIALDKIKRLEGGDRIAEFYIARRIADGALND